MLEGLARPSPVSSRGPVHLTMPLDGGTQRTRSTGSRGPPNLRDRNTIRTPNGHKRKYAEMASDEESDEEIDLEDMGALVERDSRRSARRLRPNPPVASRPAGPGPTSQRHPAPSAQVPVPPPSPPAAGGAARPDPAAAFPADSWVWVKYVDQDPTLRRIYNDHYVARTGVPSAAGKLPVAWADGTAPEEVAVHRVMRILHPWEEKIVFDGPPMPGRAASLAQVTELSKKGSINDAAPAVPRKPDGSRAFPGLVFTEGTKNFDGALEWISSSDSSFNPEDIVSRLRGALPKPPPSLLFAEKDAPGVPNIPNCVGALLKLLKQFDDRMDPVAQKLRMLHDMLPILLWRRVDGGRKTAPLKAVQFRCKQLLEGQWEKLFSSAVKALAPKKPAAPKPPAAHRPLPHADDSSNRIHASTAAKVRKAQDSARLGALSKARSILAGAGVSTSANALEEMREKHPEAPLPILPAENPDPCLSEDEVAKLTRVMSRESLCTLAERAPPNGAPDQYGWQARETLAPLLANAEIGQLLVDLILVPLSQGYVPPMYSHIYAGGRLIAMSKFPKDGSRPLAIGDCFRRLVDRALSTLSFPSLRDWFEKTYTNTIQFANGTSQGAEKYHAALLLALGGEAAPLVAQEDLDDDPIVVITLDGINAFNAVKRQLLVDILTENLSQDYGTLTQENCPALPSCVHIHFPALRAFYGEKGRLGFNNKDGTFSVVDSLNGVQQGCVNSGKFFNIATLPLVGEAMRQHPDCFAPCFSDNVQIVGRLSQAYKAADSVRINLAAGG